MSNFLATLVENLKTIFSNPLTLITLLGCAILLIAFIKFKSLKLNSKLINGKPIRAEKTAPGAAMPKDR